MGYPLNVQRQASGARRFAASRWRRMFDVFHLFGNRYQWLQFQKAHQAKDDHYTNSDYADEMKLQ